VTEEIISQALIDVLCFIIGCGLFVLEGAKLDASKIVRAKLSKLSNSYIFISCFLKDAS
jgi:hypothetical protein